MSSAVHDLKGCICLVTGASRGIGRGVAIGLGEAGATVYITARTLKTRSDSTVPGSLEDTAAEINARGGIAIPVAVDHSDDSQVASLFARIRREQKGRLDILVNNVFAGVDTVLSHILDKAKYWDLKPDESPGATWDAVNRVGLRNHYICSVLGSRIMLDYRDELNVDSEDPTSKRSDSVRPGLIFNISSFGGLRYFFNVSYCVGKSALDRMTASMSTELREANKNLSVMSIWPGMVRTETFGKAAQENSDIFPGALDMSESPELTGKIVAAIAMESRDSLIARSGRTFIVADVANSMGIKDIDGQSPCSFRSLRFLLHFLGWKRLALFFPLCLKVPYCFLTPASPKF